MTFVANRLFTQHLRINTSITEFFFAGLIATISIYSVAIIAFFSIINNFIPAVSKMT
jgi:hypothetical protein